MSAPPAPPVVVPDPIIANFAISCHRCNKPVQWRVHEGSNGALSLRGAICVMCTDYKCNWFKTYTPSYAYNDAKHFLQRHLARLINPSAYPAQLTQAGAVLRLAPPAPPPLPLTLEPLACPSGCLTQKGKPVTGNKSCVERLCKSCCMKASSCSLEGQILRPYCAAHGLKSFEGEDAQNLPRAVPLMSVVQAPAPDGAANIQTLQSILEAYGRAPLPIPMLPTSTQLSQPQTACLSQPSGDNTAPIAPTQSTQDALRPAPSQSGPSQTTSSPAPERRAAGPPSNRPRKAQDTSRPSTQARRLADPIAPGWALARQTAKEETQTVQSLKSANEGLAKLSKVLVKFTIWHTAGKPALRWQESILTFPRLQLSTLTELLRVLNPRLAEGAVIERLDVASMQWCAGKPDTVLTLEHPPRRNKEKPLDSEPPHLFLRIRPDIFTDWSEDDCPGLISDIELAGYTHPRGGLRLKRQREESAPASNLDSGPTIKLARRSSTDDVSSSAMRLGVAADPAAPSSTQPVVPGEETSEIPQELTQVTVRRGKGPGRGRKPAWPFNYTVRQLVDGFELMDNLVESQGLSKDAAFERAYQTTWTSCRSTFYKHSSLWKLAPSDLRKQFLGYGLREEGKWQAFIDALPPDVRHDKAGAKPEKNVLRGLSVSARLSSPPLEAERPLPTLPARPPTTHDDLEYLDPVVPKAVEADFIAPARYAPVEAPTTHDDLEYVDPNPPTSGNISGCSNTDDLAENHPSSPPSSVGWPMDYVSPLSSPTPLYSKVMASSAPVDLPVLDAELEEMELDPEADLSSDDESSIGAVTPQGFRTGNLLCSFCDELLPPSPSPNLIAMRTALDEISCSAPTRRNANHREYTFSMPRFERVHAYCLEHRREASIYDLGSKVDSTALPTHLDFAALPHRLVQYIPRLIQVSQDPHSNEIYLDVQLNINHNMSVKAMMAKMEKASAGYYGPKGYTIMFSLLLRLFKPALDSHWTLVHGLTTDAMIGMVLIPELTVALIQDDRGCDREGAISLLRRSHRYGVVAFPLIDEDAEVDLAIESWREVAGLVADALLELDRSPECKQCMSSLRPRRAMKTGSHAPKPRPCHASAKAACVPAPLAASSDSLGAMDPPIKTEEEAIDLMPNDSADTLQADTASTQVKDLDGFVMTIIDGQVVYELVCD